jgi:hypothetical protein
LEVAVKFITMIPTTGNDGTSFDPDFLGRVVDQLWKPFGAMSQEGGVIGRWTDDDGTIFGDVNMKISIECNRARLDEAIRAVKRAGRRLGQLAMYFEVSGYEWYSGSSNPASITQEVK